MMYKQTKLLILLFLFMANPAFAKLQVLASFSILADMCKVVGGDDIELSSLVGAAQDVHVYQPSPQAVQQLQNAELFVVNGLGLEGWQQRLQQAANFKGRTLLASRGIKRLAADFQHGKHAHSYDPHAWQDISNALIYIDNIRASMAELDPKNAANYQRRAAAYQQQLRALDQDFKRQIATVAAAKRYLVSSHLALGYLGRAYGLQILAVQGLSTEAAPSAQALARLIKLLRARQISSVFYEQFSDQRMIKQLARESGAKVAAALYVDSLDKVPPANSYYGMMRYNFTAISKALGASAN